MSEISEEIRHMMLFYYKKGKNATQTCRKICEVYGADAVSERRTQKWFIRFRSGNLMSKIDSLWSASHWKSRWNFATGRARPACELSEDSQCTKNQHVTVWNHLKKAGYAKKLDVWLPHKLQIGCYIKTQTKFDWSNFHQRNTTKTQRNRPISEANHHGR